MPSFDAGTIVEPLRVRLVPHADFDAVVDEPSDERLGAFMAGLQRLSGSDILRRFGLAPDADLSDPAQMARAAENLDPQAFVAVMAELAALFAGLCGDRPSREQILALPLRKRLLFFAWLQKEVMSPEAAPPAGNVRALTPQQQAAG